MTVANLSAAANLKSSETRGSTPGAESASARECGRTGRNGLRGELLLHWHLREKSQSYGRLDVQRGMCSRRSSAQSTCREHRTRAACGLESSGAGTRAAAKRDSARPQPTPHVDPSNAA